MISEIFGEELIGVLQNAGEVIREPSSNVAAAWLLLIIGSILLTIAVSCVVLAIIASEKKSATSLRARAAAAPAVTSAVPAEADPEVGAIPEGRPSPSAAPPRRPWLRVRSGGTLLTVTVIVLCTWLATGVLTAQDQNCTSCHVETVHTESADSATDDPHADTRCVACHESGGIIGSVTCYVPLRATHFIEGILPAANPGSGYGQRVASSSCESCHSAEIATTQTIADRGLFVSHREPLEAGATCTDCHEPLGGVISGYTVGMAPCLRCHDGQAASADCTLCHQGEKSQAVRVSLMDQYTEPRTLIEQPTCGGCHNQTSCDSCHGIRLPHTAEFMATGHARAGAEDLWYNDGQVCSKCHNEDRRPCTECHQAMPSHGPAWQELHQGTSPDGCSCHGKNEYMYGRNMCELCHE